MNIKLSCFDHSYSVSCLQLIDPVIQNHREVVSQQYTVPRIKRTIFFLDYGCIRHSDIFANKFHAFFSILLEILKNCGIFFVAFLKTNNTKGDFHVKTIA